MAGDKGIQLRLYHILLHRIVGYDFDIDSYKENLATVPLGLGLMICFFDNYLRNTADGRNNINSLVTTI